MEPSEAIADAVTLIPNSKSADVKIPPVFTSKLPFRWFKEKDLRSHIKYLIDLPTCNKIARGIMELKKLLLNSAVTQVVLGGISDNVGKQSIDTLACNEVKAEGNIKSLKVAKQVVAEIRICKEEYPNGFQLPLHYPRYTKLDYVKMEEWKLDMLLKTYGLSFVGPLEEKRAYAIGAFLWQDQL